MIPLSEFVTIYDTLLNTPATSRDNIESILLLFQVA